MFLEIKQFLIIRVYLFCFQTIHQFRLFTDLIIASDYTQIHTILDLVVLITKIILFWVLNPYVCYYRSHLYRSYRAKQIFANFNLKCCMVICSNNCFQPTASEQEIKLFRISNCVYLFCREIRITDVKEPKMSVCF